MEDWSLRSVSPGGHCAPAGCQLLGYKDKKAATYRGGGEPGPLLDFT